MLCRICCLGLLGCRFGELVGYYEESFNCLSSLSAVVGVFVSMIPVFRIVPLDRGGSYGIELILINREVHFRPNWTGRTVSMIIRRKALKPNQPRNNSIR